MGTDGVPDESERHCPHCEQTQSLTQGTIRNALTMCHEVAEGTSLDDATSNTAGTVLQELDATGKLARAKIEPHPELRVWAAPGHPLCEHCQSPLVMSSDADGPPQVRCPDCRGTPTQPLETAVSCYAEQAAGTLPAGHARDQIQAKLDTSSNSSMSIGVRCASCNAPLTVDESSRGSKCDYCGVFCLVPRQAHANGKDVVDPTAAWIAFEGPSKSRSHEQYAAMVLRIADAANPATTVDKLRALARDESSKVREAVASNRSTPREILAELVADPSEDVRTALATTTTDLDILRPLTDDGSERVLAGLAANVSAAPEVLGKLTGGTKRVREALAANPAAPAEALSQLAQDEHGPVRESVANNSNTPTTALEQLRNDRRIPARTAAATALRKRREASEARSASVPQQSGDDDAPAPRLLSSTGGGIAVMVLLAVTIPAVVLFTYHDLENPWPFVAPLALWGGFVGWGVASFIRKGPAVFRHPGMIAAIPCALLGIGMIGFANAMPSSEKAYGQASVRDSEAGTWQLELDGDGSSDCLMPTFMASASYDEVLFKRGGRWIWVKPDNVAVGVGRGSEQRAERASRQQCSTFAHQVAQGRKYELFGRRMGAHLAAVSGEVEVVCELPSGGSVEARFEFRRCRGDVVGPSFADSIDLEAIAGD